MDASSDFLRSILLHGNCGELEFAAITSTPKFFSTLDRETKRESPQPTDPSAFSLLLPKIACLIIRICTSSRGRVARTPEPHYLISFQHDLVVVVYPFLERWLLPLLVLLDSRFNFLMRLVAICFCSRRYLGSLRLLPLIVWPFLKPSTWTSCQGHHLRSLR